MTLVVGPRSVKLPCHRNLLAYFSEFFSRGLKGNFKESREDVFALPEEDVDDIQCFVTWAYTGEFIGPNTSLVDVTELNKSPSAIFKLWVLGDRLLAPRFANRAMAHIFAWLTAFYLTPDCVRYTYDNTVPGAPLRLLVRDVILVEGPFSAKCLKDSRSRKTEWTELIGEGGDFVIDVVTHGGFSIYSKTTKPYDAKNCQKYLKEEGGRSAGEWVASSLGG